MEHRDKILEYYHSGRYECDYHFHLELKNVLEELNLYSWVPTVQSQLLTLKKITELTQINANSLDEDYDDEEGVCQTYKIRQLISQLNTKDIPLIIGECEALSWEPYSAKLCRQLQGKKDYEAIIQRIHTTIHSHQFRIDSMLFTGFFELVNQKQLDQLLQSYTKTIQHFLQYLSSQRKNFHTLMEAQEYSNIGRMQKVQHYVGALYLTVRTCLRFCEIVKILTGRNNLSLKFTVVRKELQKLMRGYPEWKFQQQKEDLFSVLGIFKKYLQNGQPINKTKICRYCFKSLKNELHFHSFCNILINKKETFQ